MQLTITTFVTPDYVGKLNWTLPTWNIKPQFRDVPIVIFTNGFQNNYSSLDFVKEYYKDITIIDWNPTNTTSRREMVFSSFVFGTEHIKTPFYVKLDGDAFFTNEVDIFNTEDESYDLVGHSWNYTKPGWWIPYLENFYNKTELVVDQTQIGRYEHRRIASFCCLHKTEWVKNIASILNNKLPVPSHDTTLWFYADKMGRWRGKNVKKLGCDNNTRWRSIREAVCISRFNQTPMLNRELLSHVQLEITSFCQLKCFNCDRNCGIAPTLENMSLEQISKFVGESLTLNHEWKRIDIIGGEPTYHPQLNDIWKFIKIYKDRYPNCIIRFSTNGLGPKTQEVIRTLPNWVSTRNSGKTHREQEFVAYNSAPIDNGNIIWKCCSVPWRCGMGLTRYGYFPCGAGASVARVFGIDIGIKNLKDVNPTTITNQFPLLCTLCGHSQVPTRHVTNQPDISQSWQKATQTYQTKKLSLY